MAVGDEWLTAPDEWSTAFRQGMMHWDEVSPGDQTHSRVLGYPKLSQMLLQQNAPNWVARSYVGMVGEFGQGMSDHILITRMQNAYTEKWRVVGEFEDLPHTKLGFTRFSGRVQERGIAIPLTERTTIFSTFAIESIVKTYLSDIVRNSIDRDIFEEAIFWTDFVFYKTTGGLQVIKGQATGDAQSRISNTPRTFYAETNPVTVPLINFVSALGSSSPAPIVANDILRVREELIKRRMKGIITTVICNSKFERDLLSDPDLALFFAYQRAEAISRNELGVIRGFQFVVDDTGVLDELLDSINNRPNPADPAQDINATPFRSIAIFIAQDGYRELVALPETVRVDLQPSFQRFMRIGAITYSGYLPLWLYADNKAYEDPSNPPTSLPERVRRSAGIVMLGG